LETIVTEGEKGYIFHGKEKVVLSEIRGAVIGPNLDDPGYCVFFGRRTVTDKTGNFLLPETPLLFLSEIQEKVQADLVDRVIEEAKNLFCHTLYADFEQEELFSELHDKLGATKLYPCFPWPFEEDLEAGILRIRQYAFKKLLEIPNGTILSGQLGSVAPDRLKELKLYTLKVLHYLVVWFQKVKAPELILEYRERKTKEVREEVKKGLDNVSQIAMGEIEEIEKAIKAGLDPSNWGDMEREAWRWHNV